MKLWCVFFIAIIATSQSASILDVALDKWIAFKAEFKKVYNEQEEIHRMRTFFGSFSKVKEHNDNYEKGLVSYKLSLNKFADTPREELSRTLHGYASKTQLSGDKDDDDSARIFVPPINVTIPDFVNWIGKGAVTPVKNQANCGSCWAFSSTGALEAQHFLKTGKLVSLSEQNLIDCTGVRDCQRGGLMIDAFNYVKNNDGIDTEDAYPYEAEIKTCRYDPKKRGVEDIGYIAIEEGNEEHLKAAIATVGPISAAIDAKHESFHFYTEGIYHEPNCSKTELNHAVLIVGYGTDGNGKNYWLIKNSWNEDWGEEGYIRMIRNENMCGIANKAVYPIV